MIRPATARRLDPERARTFADSNDASIDPRMRLKPVARRMLYATIALLVGSGAGWLVMHYASAFDDLRRLAFESLLLKFHGAAAFAMLVAVGAMWVHHARRGLAIARNRISGISIIAMLALLIMTGYALYYLVTDLTRTPISMAHWLVGVAFVPLFIAHLMIGRRGWKVRRGHTRRIKRKAAPHSSAR
jgi:hypothetical protein